MLDFTALHNKHERQIVSLVTRLLGPHHRNDAQDVAQDVWLRVALNLQHFRGDAEPGSWIYRIAFNTTMTYLRSSKARARAKAVSLTAAMHLIDTRLEPHDLTLLSKQLKVKVDIALMDRMPYSYAEAIRLRYAYGMSLKEMAARTGIPISTVKSRLHRARQIVLQEVGAK